MGQALTCKELLEMARQRGMTDTEICNRARRLEMKLDRTTLWRIRNDRLKGSPYLSTLLKLAKVLGHG
jgi:hypothetical protein